MHYISTYQSADPQRGIGMMPKRGCDVNTCEIAKFYRLNNNGLCQVVSMTVPRRSELFQEDLYPDTLSDEAAVTAEEWSAGTDAEPILVSLKVRWPMACANSSSSSSSGLLCVRACVINPRLPVSVVRVCVRVCEH